MTTAELFEALKEDAGADGAAILIFVHPERDLEILVHGETPAKVSWLMDIGDEYVQQYCDYYAKLILERS